MVRRPPAWKVLLTLVVILLQTLLFLRVELDFATENLCFVIFAGWAAGKENHETVEAFLFRLSYRGRIPGEFLTVMGWIFLVGWMVWASVYLLWYLEDT